MTAGEIANRFGCTWPTTRHHLRLLEVARLVNVEKHGRERVYVLDGARLAHVAHGWLKSFASPAEETT
jgi:DNA-binding transcriptional ArsR family regulator